MTKKELSQLYYLKKETAELQCRIVELETLATNSTSKITGLPHSIEISDKVGKNAAKIADLKVKLEEILGKCIIEIDKLTAFINSTSDSQMRLILTLRYIKHLSWNDVAKQLCYEFESSPRQLHERFLKLTEKTEFITL